MASSEQELFRLGFDRTVRDAMVRDWMGLGASSYVILVQHRRSKEPDNIVFCGDGTGWPKAERLLKALRLLAPGDVSMGGMWRARAARFDVGCRPGLRMTGWSLPAPPGGSEYELTTGVLGQLPTVYGQLLHLDTHGLGQAPGNLDLGAVQGREGSRQRSCLLWEPSVLHSVAHHHGHQRGHNRQHLNRAEAAFRVRARPRQGPQKAATERPPPGYRDCAPNGIWRLHDQSAAAPDNRSYG